MAPAPARTSSETLLSTLHALNHKFDAAFPAGDAAQLHALSAQPPDVTYLSDVLTSSALFTASLLAHAPVADPKLVSLYREYVNHADSASRMHADTAAKTRAVRARPSIYGEDIPFERSLLPGWIVSRVEACARAAGLDTYKDENAKEGNVSLLCGGKAVVLDVEFRIRPLHLPSADDIGIGLSSIKISVAPPAEGTALPASPYEIHLDNLFQSLVSEFITLAHAANADCLLAARPMAEFQRHLEYLMHIDRLATEEGEAGARWFRHVGSTAAFAEGICTQEASALSTLSSTRNIPLDVLLNVGHTLPLAYLNSPCLSFLVHLPPASYLSLLRSMAQPNDTDTSGPFDIPSKSLRTHLRSSLFNPSPKPTQTIANLLLTSPSPRVSPSQTSIQPQDPIFPLLSSPPASCDFPQLGKETQWVLEFQGDGVVMRRSAMKKVAELCGIVGGDEMVFSGMDGTGPSWVDTLLYPAITHPTAQYTSIHKSPSAAYPPLHYNFLPPNEPALMLKRIPVTNMSTVWQCLEVVRDQCWINEILLGASWERGRHLVRDRNEEQATVDTIDFETLLSGIYTPTSLPVQLSLGAQFPSTALVLTFPLPLPSSPLGRATVTHSIASVKGVVVELEGIDDPMGMNAGPGLSLKERAEEVVRRGGCLSLPGWIWKTLQMGQGVGGTV